MKTSLTVVPSIFNQQVLGLVLCVWGYTLQKGVTSQIQSCVGGIKVLRVCHFPSDSRFKGLIPFV